MFEAALIAQWETESIKRFVWLSCEVCVYYYYWC